MAKQFIDACWPDGLIEVRRCLQSNHLFEAEVCGQNYAMEETAVGRKMPTQPRDNISNLASAF